MPLPALFPSLQGYERSSLRADLVAGLTVWAVLVPEALAYAAIAGVSPVVGLYAAPGALLLYAVFGSSRYLVVGPMSATAALSAAIVGDLATDGSQVAALTATLAICVGGAGLVAGLLRLGFLASFVSEPVLKGFIVGLALTIVIGQVPDLLGVDGGSGSFFEKAWALLGQIGDTQGWTLTVGGLSLLVVLGLKRLAPAVPASLVVVALGIVAVVTLGLDDKGVEIVGAIDPGLPALGVPEASRTQWGSLLGSAVGVVLIGFAEGLGAAKTYAARDGEEVDANRELVGLGAANVASGLSSGMVVNGSLSKTAVNGGAGARSQVSGLVVAALTLLTLLFLTGLFEELPLATLAAVVIAAVIELVDVRALVGLYRTVSGPLREIYGRFARADFLAATAALLGVLLFDTLPGLVIGIGVSMALLVYRVSRPHVAVLERGAGGLWVDTERQDDLATVAGVVVVRPESPLVFANADAVRRRVRSLVADDTRAVVIDCETVASIDISAARMLGDLARDLEGRGISLAMARDVGQVRDVLALTDHDEALSRVFPTVRAAVAAVAPSDSAGP